MSDGPIKPDYGKRVSSIIAKDIAQLRHTLMHYLPDTIHRDDAIYALKDCEESALQAVDEQQTILERQQVET